MSSRVNLAGQRVGRLLVLSAHAVDRYSGTDWLCRCDCGREEVRHGAGLLQAQRRGRSPACLGCQSDARRVSRRALWERTGSLYTIGQIAALREAVRNDLVEAFGPVREEESAHVDEALRW